MIATSSQQKLKRSPSKLPKNIKVPTVGEEVVKKCVRFPTEHRKLEVTRRISRISSRSLAEIIAVWGDEKEEQERHENIRRDIHRIVLFGETSDEFDLCTLGLADKIGVRAKEKVWRREQAWDAVMWNQHDQHEENIDHSVNYNEVARVYTKKGRTLEVQQQAQTDAAKLAEKVQRELRSDQEVRNLLRRFKALRPNHTCRRLLGQQLDNR